MLDKTNAFLKGRPVGIIGCGELGSAIGEKLICCKLPRDQLLLSCRGSTRSLENIEKTGFSHNLVDSDVICRRAKIIFLAVKPQDCHALEGYHFPEDALIVSLMAGVQRRRVEKLVRTTRVVRAIPSNPNTLKRGDAIVGVYPPDDEVVGELFSDFNCAVYQIPEEDLMHVFAMCTSIPAIILFAGDDGDDLTLAIDRLQEKIAVEAIDLRAVYKWALQAVPTGGSTAERKAYALGMRTEGGVTDAMIKAIEAGGNMLQVMRSGIERSKELSQL